MNAAGTLALYTTGPSFDSSLFFDRGTQMAPRKVAPKKPFVADIAEAGQAAQAAQAGQAGRVEDVEEVEVVDDTVDEEVDDGLEEIEEIDNGGGKHVGFVLDSEDEYDEGEGEDGDEDDLVCAVTQVGQLLVTEDGEAVADVLRGLVDALDKQNKILYRGLQLLEARR